MKRRRFSTLLAFAAGSLCVGCTPVPTPQRPTHVYILPDGYVGWVLVHHGLASEPALPVQNGKIMVIVPPTGEVRTSSPSLGGWQQQGTFDEYYYASSLGLHPLHHGTHGRGGMIWFKHNGAQDPPGPALLEFEGFFVGSESHFRRQKDVPDAPGPQLPLPPSAAPPSP